jgi:hypothetical protein
MQFEWHCHLLIWGINLVAGLGIIVFNLIFLADSIDNKWATGIVGALLILVLVSYQVVSMPYRVLINYDLLTIKWPWRTYRVYRDKVRKLAVKQIWLKTAHIVILQDKMRLHNFLPIFLTWEFQPDDDPNVVSAIKAWCSAEPPSLDSPILTNEEVTTRGLRGTL